MMSASEGVHGKADVVREVARILPYESVPNEDEGGGVKISKNFADFISGILGTAPTVTDDDECRIVRNYISACLNDSPFVLSRGTF